MKSLILLLTVLLTACGYEKEKDKDKAPPRLVALNVEHDPDDLTQTYYIIIEGRTSTETVDQFIAYEISASIMKDEEPESCTTGDDVRVFYQQERIEVEPESKYYIRACSMNKENGTISEELMKVVRTEEMPEDPLAEFDEEVEGSIDPDEPFCEQEPNHVLCTEPANACDRDPTLCEPSVP